MVIFCQKSNADDLQVEEAVVVLRQSLAKAESKSVTIVTVGFLTNIRLCNSNITTWSSWDSSQTNMLSHVNTLICHTDHFIIVILALLITQSFFYKHKFFYH